MCIYIYIYTYTYTQVICMCGYAQRVRRNTISHNVASKKQVTPASFRVIGTQESSGPGIETRMRN